MNEYNISQMADVVNFEMDTLKGLSSVPKYLLSKYLYDDYGTAIFQEITKMPEYYLTKCEQEIFENQKEKLTEAFIGDNSPFDLIELGSGDGSKTKILLKLLLQKQPGFRYIPVDISSKANGELFSVLSKEIPSLNISPLTGDYFNLTGNEDLNTGTRKVILFLGSNIGNFSDPEIHLFLTQISRLCRKGDMLLTGFDLKKSPAVILKAYDDPYGYTRRFNLNHLIRLNRELDADFDVDRFDHHTCYNPASGYLKSSLVSNEQQAVHIRSLGLTVQFDIWEPVFMEISRKFDLAFVDMLAVSHGFSIVNHFTDQRSWFADSLWVRK